MRLSTFIPLAKATLYSDAGYTVDGRPALGKGVQIGVAPIHLNSKLGPTSIRTDKSGTQGRAEETVFAARVLVEPGATLKHGDVLDLYGLMYRIEVIFPRYEMTGDLHHYQVDLVRWAG